MDTGTEAEINLRPRRARLALELVALLGERGVFHVVVDLYVRVALERRFPGLRGDADVNVPVEALEVEEGRVRVRLESGRIGGGEELARRASNVSAMGMVFVPYEGRGYQGRQERAR